MINIPFFQNEWLGIKFSDLNLKTSSYKIPNANFYSKLFIEFDNKYINLKDLPSNWVEEKHKISNYFIEHKKEKNILSYGSGTGVIEIKIKKEGGKITCSDFTSYIGKFIKENKLNFVDINEIKQKYDVIFFSNVLYTFNKGEIKKLIQRLKMNLNSKGEFIIVFKEKKKVKIKDFIRILYLLTFKNNQFWGYERDSKFYSEIFLSEGFNLKSKELISVYTILTFSSQKI